MCALNYQGTTIFFGSLSHVVSLASQTYNILRGPTCQPNKSTCQPPQNVKVCETKGKSSYSYLKLIPDVLSHDGLMPKKKIVLRN